MSPHFLLGPVALPLSESAEGLGVGAPASTDATPAESDSLSDHEAEFGPEARAAEQDDEVAPAATTERDDTGKFKPKQHRAKSQQAGPDDVPRIKDLTQKWRTTEAERDALKVEREAIARERDELKARLEKPAAKPAAAETVASSDAFDFPDYDKYLETHPDASYNVWHRAEMVAYNDWRDQRTDLDGRIAQTIAARESARDIHHVVEHTRAKGREVYADFDTVLTSGPGAQVNLHADEATAKGRVAFIFQHPQSEHLQYAIMKDAALAQRLASLDDIGFGLELSTLVASAQRSPSSRSAAASTGSAPALVRPPAPRPPNPVRTGSIAEPDTPPDPDDQSLSSHERFFGRKRTG